MKGINLAQELAAIEDRPFIVVSNRQPYAHVREEDRVRVEKPPSGLTLALEPIVQATRGTWIAASSGNADREFVDAEGRVLESPPEVRYQLRRLFLPAALAQDFYNGFANSSLWPLCHIAYQKPRFEERWWQAYVEANRRFADAVVQQVGDSRAIVFVQDFHLALLPAIVRERCPHALVAQFWHIPWPNPEAFRICPWRKELLQGLLGNHLLGFHLPYHRMNFFETVDRELQVRIDRETNTVIGNRHRTQVRAFPISVDYEAIRSSALREESLTESAAIRERHGAGRRLVLSVERMDYSKGILERLDAIQRFFERHPAWVGRVHFVHIATPSRTRVRAYRDYAQEVERALGRLNAALATPDWTPVTALHIYVEPEKIWNWYHAADALVVSSLHDGMNLVAKEYVAAAREDGVLILSEFTGAARELREAVLVNPYATDQFADHLAAALELPPAERQQRMRRLRWRVSHHDVAAWAGDILRAIRQNEFDSNHHAELPGPTSRRQLRLAAPAVESRAGAGRQRL